MTATTRTLLALLATGAAVAAFWFVAMAPKRERANELGTQVESLRAKVAEQEQAIATGVEARRSFPASYHQLVLLGKAVPAKDESASLLVQVNEIAGRAGVEFRQLEVDSATTPAAATPAPPLSGEPSVSEVPEGGATATATTASTAPAPPTEAAAASLPIGATVGPAGLGVLPFKLQFRGNFFEISDFLEGLDRLVKTESGHVAVDGRLVTVSGFSLSQDESRGFPSLVANLVVTTFVTPTDQGLTAGATPAAPAPAGTLQATPTSATTP
jgi:outer membrane murein-binding lipoprotein Lpp